DLVLFYFSGHGYHFDGKNYLIPIKDADMEDETDIPHCAANVQGILDRLMEGNPPYATIMILDCCRPYFIKNASTSSRPQKLALIIGNYDYSDQKNKLTQFVKNVNDLSKLLETIDFQVTSHCNIKENMIGPIQDFCKKIIPNDLVLFYFSGHGYHFDGKNYLIPIKDADMEDETEVPDYAADVQRILDRLIENNLPCVTVMILDCCRPYFIRNPSISGRK
ncbi:unnamed protein product, partial [Rotaria sp. Silwood2]